MKLLPLCKSVALSVSFVLSGIAKKRLHNGSVKLIFKSKNCSESQRESSLLLVVAVFSFLFCIGCSKEIETSFPGATRKPAQASFPKITIYPAIKCINSYPQLINELKTTTVRVRKIILHDGTLINSGGPIINITYTAINIQEPFSLFRSELRVVYNLYGYQQENTTNCWSLGCVYQHAGVPPFTTVLKDRSVLLINTSFVWNLPGGNGRGIKYLIVD